MAGNGLNEGWERKPAETAPLVLLYADGINARIRYTGDFIFRQVLGCRFAIADTPAALAPADIRICYTEKPCGGFHIRPSGLLAEKGIVPGHFRCAVKDGEIMLLRGELPQDILSAVFFFISRYEEHLPLQVDSHDRFPASASVLYRCSLLLKPVVDLWISRLKDAISAAFPGIEWPGKRFVPLSTIDVDNLYAYRHKGIFRTAGGFLKDLLRNDRQNLSRRWRVVTGKERDPFDVYDAVCELHKDAGIGLRFFFLVRSGTRHDRTVSSPEALKEVIETVTSKGGLVGLHPSYYTYRNGKRLKSEAKQLSSLSGGQVTASRQHYLRFHPKTTPQLLTEAGINVDFSMGFANVAGFRAGTSHPFRHYDFTREEATSLLMVPFCAMDGAYTMYGKNSPDEAFRQLTHLAGEVRRFGGFFVTVFHERTFDDQLHNGYGRLYERLVRHLNALQAEAN